MARSMPEALRRLFLDEVRYRGFEGRRPTFGKPLAPVSVDRASGMPRFTTPALLAGRVLGAALAVAVLSPGEAAAFCRSTTCSGDCARDEFGCKTEGAPLAWPGMCVGYSLQKDGTANISIVQVRKVIAACFVAWSDLECPDGELATLAFSELDDVGCHRTEYAEDHANANIVLFQDNNWTYQGIDNTLAKTTVTFDNESGEIFDADIEINHAYNEFTVSDTNVVYDLQSVVTHEVGHFIGLDHSDDFDATMYARYDEGTVELRTLEPDDIEAACAVYPPGRDATCDPQPRGGFAYDCAPDEDSTATQDEGGGCAISRTESAAPWLFALGLAVLAAGARRRASRLPETRSRTCAC